MRLKAIDHISINVVDLNETVKFYTNVFGLKTCGTVDMGDHVLTYMDLPGRCRLELIQYHYGHGDASICETDRGILRHVAFEVEYLKDIKKQCDRHNVDVKLQPVHVENLNCTAMLIRDPNGIEIELVEKDSKPGIYGVRKNGIFNRY